MVVPAAAFFLVLVIALAVSGCSQYGEVSKDAYDIALASTSRVAGRHQ